MTQHIKINKFDDSRAKSYRKRLEVLAFRSEAPILYSKSFGKQEIRGGGWIVVPLSDTGQPMPNIHGVDAAVFSETYEISPSLRPNRYRKKESVRAYQPGSAFIIDTVLSDEHIEVKGAQTNTYDAWIVQAPGGEIYLIENSEFRRTYIEIYEPSDKYRVMTRDEHWASDGTPKRILTLDGGGVRGILTLGYLERIEEILKKRHGGFDDFRLCHYFDLIAGTSTGAIIAAGLAKGLKVSELRDKYDKLASSVFKRSFFRWGLFRSKYRAKQLKTHLKGVFVNNTMGSQALQTGLLVVAKRLDSGKVWPMNNNPGHPFFTAAPGDSFLSNEDYSLHEVVRASTAAPTYFAPEFIEISSEKERPRGQFVDGGVSPHNNPALLALQLATVKGFGAGWPLDPDKLLLVSVGTGSAQPGHSKSWFSAHHAITALLSLMDDCAESVETILQWLSNSPTARHIDATVKDLSSDLLAERPLLQYLRYNVRFDSDWLTENLEKSISKQTIKKLKKMDRPENMPILSELGVRAAERQIKDSHFPKSFDLE